MSKAKEEYYAQIQTQDYKNIVVGNYIKELEQQNQGFWEMIKVLSVALDKTNKILGIKIKTLTGKPIDEVLKDE